MGDAFLIAISEATEPFRLLMLLCGVLAGLVIGVIPGLGGIFGMAILIPLTYQLDPYAALALLLGMGSVTTTSDTIPAVLLGVPGTVGATATVIDGHELAKQNQAGRAFSAAYSASMVGGVFGALVLALSIPVMEPLVLLLKTPDFLAIAVFGISLVALLAGNQPVKGIGAALIGVTVSYIGIDDHEAAERWTFGALYLWEGLPVAVVFLGLFGLTELSGFLKRGSIGSKKYEVLASQTRMGLMDSWKERRLVLQSSALGAVLGAIPGVGLSVIDWIAYGIASRQNKDGPKFGDGNIRGVIAPEAASNAKEGGALIPTIALGLPGSASMSILLGAFVVHGLIPGPDMLGVNAPVTISMIFMVAIANIMGAGICLWMTGPLAKIALVPASMLVPVTVLFIVLGAIQTNASIGDVGVLLGFGFLGMAMKRYNWPRPAFALGFVLGPSIETNFFLAHQISGWDWLGRPLVIGVAALFLLIAVRKYMRRNQGAVGLAPVTATATTGKREEYCALIVVGCVGLYVLMTALPLPASARVFPVATSVLLVAVVGVQLMLHRFRPALVLDRNAWLETIKAFRTDAKMLGMVVWFSGMIFLIGHMAAVLFTVPVTVYMLGERRKRPMIYATIGSALVTYLIFDRLISVAWPNPVLIDLIPI